MSTPSNIAKLRWAKQSAQGTVATASAFGAYLAGGDQPSADVTDEMFVETTGGRMLSDAYRSQVHVAGAPQFYLMPKSVGSLLYGVLGAKSVSGAGDPYTHIFTAATSRPWFTFWRMVANLIWGRYGDCKIDKLVIHGETGKPLTVTATILGISPASQTTEETTVAIEIAQRYLHYDGLGALLVEGAAVASIDNFDITIDNHGQAIGGDALTPIDISEGELTVTVAIRKLFLSASLHNRVIYGAASPTNNTAAVAAVLELAGSPAGIEFTFTRVAASPGPTRSLKLAVPRLRVVPFQIQPATSQDPLREQLTLEALAPTDGSSPITATLLNGVAAY